MPDQMQDQGGAEDKNLPAEEQSEKEHPDAQDVDLEMPADYQEYVVGGQDSIRPCTHTI